MQARANGRRAAASTLLMLFAAAVLFGLWRVPAPPTPQEDVSLAQRPTWPYAWALAAQQQPQQAEALRAQAVALGPSERNLRTRLALRELHDWSQLSPQGREQARADLRFALQVQPQNLLRTAFSLRREQLVCALWTQGGDIAQVCANMAGVRRICDRPHTTLQLSAWCFEHGVLPAPRDD
ncbi:hypothetical protein SAMN04488038_1229 [Solimonas aquatica]|uniref:Uncharacterized protein n=1 Tax=Solimonas aquatica TaxID=489703 RepID=A0A1H9MF14_9GAMM|nr:hypothetical protein [Solimonas aquatica]SER22099.1 hypothetical protein SAMN04488038_1229 [Solimonas aquatica]